MGIRKKVQEKVLTKNRMALQKKETKIRKFRRKNSRKGIKIKVKLKWERIIMEGPVQVEKIKLPKKIKSKQKKKLRLKKKRKRRPKSKPNPKIKKERGNQERATRKRGRIKIRWMSQPTTECGVSILQSSRFWRNASRTKSRTNWKSGGSDRYSG